MVFKFTIWSGLAGQGQTQFRTRREAKAALFEYIEIFYNRRRRHSGIDYRTPAQAHAEMLVKAAA
jgi:putative transposase